MNVRALFGKNLRKARLSKGLSQEQLAFNTGLHRTYIGGIERGERNPTIENVAKLALALEQSPAAFFKNWKPS